MKMLSVHTPITAVTLAKVAWLTLAILVTLLAAGVFENYQNDPTRGCSKFDASANYWGYDCKNGSGFFEAK